jgi:hypothetical protein
MSHDVSKVVLAGTLSSAKDVECFNVDPASFPAGVCVSMASTGLPSLLKSAGFRMGVSRGKSLSDHKKTDVLRTGLRVPVLASYKRASGVITVTSYANLVSGTDDVVTVGATAFTAQAGAATPGGATFQAATSNNATATSLAAQINAHATASTLVYAVASSATVTLYSIVAGVGSTGTGNDIALSYTDNDTNVGITLSGLSGGKLSGGLDTVAGIDYDVIGGKMYVNDVTGYADANISGFTTVTDAVYVAGAKTGINEAGAEVAAVLVDMQGGL